MFHRLPVRLTRVVQELRECPYSEANVGQVVTEVYISVTYALIFFVMNSMVLTSGEVTGLSQDRVSKQDAVAGKHKKQIV